MLRAFGFTFHNGAIPLTQLRGLLEQLADLVEAIEKQEALNEENIGRCFNALEAVMRRIGLREPVWIAVEISNFPSRAFGWSQCDGEWCLMLGNYESCLDPDSGDTVVYASSEKRIGRCAPFEQARAFDDTPSLIQTIYAHLKLRHEQTQKRGDDILDTIRKLEVLFKGGEK